MNIFEFAMQMEKDGEEYYRELAANTTNQGLQAICRMLAEDEAKHFGIMKQVRDAMNPRLVETEILSRARNVFQQLKEEGGKTVVELSQIELYRRAQEIEKKSEAFYLEKAAAVMDDYVHGLLTGIAGEEARHYFLLENIIQFVSRPDTWLENAEFTHLDDY